jgi:hypothetical protein
MAALEERPLPNGTVELKIAENPGISKPRCWRAQTTPRG